MALTNTTLSAACSASDTRLYVTSATGAVAGTPMKVDNEYIGGIVTVSTTGYVDVRMRGSEGTNAVAHNTLARVQFCASPADFPSVPVGSANNIPPFVDQLVSYSTSGAIDVPIENTTAFMTGASAQAMTLAAPSVASDGVKLALTSQSSAAHTINAAATSALIASSTSGGPASTVTMAAFVGGGLTLMASKGLWNVVANNLSTFS